jgi:hypothetical protein
MSIDDSGFESEDQIFYSDEESELSFEILHFENIEHHHNNLQLDFMRDITPIENNHLQLQDHSDILQVSEDLDQLLGVMENQARMDPTEQHEDQLLDVMEDQARMDPTGQHEDLMRALETPVVCAEERCTIRGCVCEENRWGTKNPNYSDVSEDFAQLCDSLETACAQEQPRTSTPIPRKTEKECQTETQEGHDERIYDGEETLMKFTNEQVYRIIAKNDKFREETFVKEQNMKAMCDEANEKCQAYCSETQALKEEMNRMREIHVGQLINLDAMLRTKDLELRAARTIIENNIAKSQQQTSELHNMRVRMQRLQDENMRQRNAQDRERRLGQRRANQFYNSEHRIRTQHPAEMYEFNRRMEEEATTSNVNNFSFQRENNEATTSRIFRFGKTN